MARRGGFFKFCAAGDFMQNFASSSRSSPILIAIARILL